MFAHDPLHGRETYARSFEILGAVQALKHTEQFVRVFHVEAHPIIPHENRFPPGNHSFAHRDFGRGSGASIFHGICQQVGENLLDQAGIAFG